MWNTITHTHEPMPNKLTFIKKDEIAWIQYRPVKEFEDLIFIIIA